MRLSIRFLLLLLPVLAAVVFAFNHLMVDLERRWALTDLYTQANLIFQSIQDPLYESVAQGKLRALHRIYKRIDSSEGLVGLQVCSNKGKIISRSPRFPRAIRCDWDPTEPTPKQAKLDSKVLSFDNRSYHRAVFPLFDEEGISKAYVLVLHDPAYLSARSDLSRRYTLFAFLGLGVLISLITLLVYRWSVSRPMRQLSEVMKGVLTGDSEKISKALQDSELAPLVGDLDEMLFHFQKKKGANGKANGATSTKNPNIWTPERLVSAYQEKFGESRICVLANESPYVHNRKGHSVEVKIPANGVVTAIDPIMQAISGIWIGRGTGTADHETADKNGMVLVPPEQPSYALKRIWLTREEEQGFYYGLSNEGLWPLCHIAHERPIFRQEDWQQYVEVNAKYASTFNEEVKTTRPIAWIQNHNLALTPGMIRKMRPDALVTMLWHIPWPSADSFRICPWRTEILSGLLGADLIVFQSPQHETNFFDSVDRFLEARVDRDHSSVSFQGGATQVKSLPVSVNWPSRHAVAEAKVSEVREKVLNSLSVAPNSIVGLGMDRLDYTKGIIERLMAVERLLEKHPELIGRFVYVEVAAPTNRMHLKRYQDLNSEIQNVADRINWKFFSDAYKPIIVKMEHHSREEVHQFYQAADFCFVGAIHDGMNLVAKEFVASRNDEKGVLILSGFTGASRELKDALIVNPYDTDECANAMYRAARLEPEEITARMRKMRMIVSEYNVYKWADSVFEELHRIAERRLQGAELIVDT